MRHPIAVIDNTSFGVGLFIFAFAIGKFLQKLPINISLTPKRRVFVLVPDSLARGWDTIAYMCLSM